jgi:hypothetical protein
LNPLPHAADLADAVLAEFERRESLLRDEQAVRGLDSLSEVELHPIIAAGLAALEIGILREVPYPHEWTRQKNPAKADARPRDTEPGPTLVHVASTDAFPESVTESAPARLPDHRDRMRCDLVLSPSSGQTLQDALLEEKRERTRKAEARGTLFERLAADAPPSPTRNPAVVPPEEAYWLEVKSVAQFDLSSGVPGFARAYASSLVKSLTGDLFKLAEDPRIQLGGVLLVLFTLDRATADHDLPLAIHKCLDKDLPIASPEIRRVQITDRLGNGLCTLCLIGLRR